MGRDYSSLSRWLIRPAALHRSIPTLYLSSPPSGCNPDSDSSALSLSAVRPVFAGSESTWLGILTPIQVNVPSGLVFNCQCTVRDDLFVPSPLLNWDPCFVGGVFRGKFKKIRKKARRVKKCLHVGPKICVFGKGTSVFRCVRHIAFCPIN